MIFENSKTYDILKFIATHIGPIVVFLSTLVTIWGIPYGAQITATLAAIEVLISEFVKASKRKYTKQFENFDAAKGEDEPAELVEEQK